MKTKRKRKIVTTSFLFRNVPTNLRDHFKAACALRGIHMRDKVLSMIREWLNGFDKEK